MMAARFRLHAGTLGIFLAAMPLTWAQPTAAKQCQIDGVTTYTGKVHDVLATDHALYVASDGGVEEFDRKTRRLRRKYTHLDGLSRLAVKDLAISVQGGLIAVTDESRCTLKEARFECAPSKVAVAPQPLRFSYQAGARVTAEVTLKEGKLIGTAGKHAFLGHVPLSQSELPDHHVTALALFSGRLWVGTFNGGLANEGHDGKLRPRPSPDLLINALATGSKHLFVGTSRGLYQTSDGVTFQRVSLVEDAVVGLAFDGTSIWATSPGALYRIKDGKGPPSDVWWLPGGSRSLQKVSAVPGTVWFGTEDRGAVAMHVGPTTVSRDKPFTVYDRSAGLASSWSLAVAALPDGGAFMTTLREGVSLIFPDEKSAQGSKHSVLRRSLPLSDWGLAALATENGAWIGTQGGAAFMPVDTTPPSVIKGLPDERVHAFLEDNREGRPARLYIGTENGLAWCEPT